MSISQLNCLLFGANDSWSLTPNSDNQSGKPLAGSWQKSRYKKCFEAFSKLKIEPKLGPYFGIIFSFVEGTTKNCEFKIYQLEDRVYKLDSGKLKFGCLITQILAFTFSQ